MKNKNVYRIFLGVKKIGRKKWLILIPSGYLAVISIMIWNGRNFLKSLDGVFSAELFEWLFLTLMVEVAVIGLMLILTALGTPKSSKSTEDGLVGVGFTDKLGETAMLVSKVKDHNGFILEFYSPKIPFCDYEKYRKLIEPPLNMKIVSVDQGRDMQHVKVKAIPSGGDTSEMIRWNNQLLSQDDFILKLGENYFGDEEFDLAITPHVLIGGGSGSGKTKLLKLLLLQCVKKNANIYLADFKGGIDYPKVWHEKCSIITNAEELSERLSVILEIMEERRIQLVESGASNINEHNRKTGANIHRIIVACDEIAEVLDKTGLEKDEKIVINKIESKFSTLSRQGRAFGIHLIFATQRPDADVLKGQIKNNLGMRICGRADKVLSQIILDSTEAADKISQRDQGIFLTNSGVLFKAYYVEDEYLEGV